MADNKKTVVVYTDWIDKFEELTDDEAGKLIKHFFRYVNDQNPEAPDRTTKLMFIDIKNTLKRDLNKYDDTLEKRRDAGALGNLKRYNKDLYEIVQKGNMTIKEAQDLAKCRKEAQDLAKLADNVSDSVSGSVSVSEIIDKSITIKKEVKPDYSNHINFKDLTVKDKLYLESIAMNKRTNIKTVSFYLTNFNAHLISERKIKDNLKEYQIHYKRWLNLQKVETIKEQTRNLYKDLDKDL